MPDHAYGTDEIPDGVLQTEERFALEVRLRSFPFALCLPFIAEPVDRHRRAQRE